MFWKSKIEKLMDRQLEAAVAKRVADGAINAVQARMTSLANKAAAASDREDQGRYLMDIEQHRSILRFTRKACRAASQSEAKAFGEATLERVLAPLKKAAEGGPLRLPANIEELERIVAQNEVGALAFEGTGLCDLPVVADGAQELAREVEEARRDPAMTQEQLAEHILARCDVSPANRR